MMEVGKPIWIEREKEQSKEVVSARRERRESGARSFF